MKIILDTNIAIYFLKGINKVVEVLKMSKVYQSPLLLKLNLEATMQIKMK